MKNNNTKSLFFMKLISSTSIYQIQFTELMIASRADKFRMLSKFGPESWALWAVVSAIIDCCNAQIQIPKRDILLSFENKRDRSYCIHSKKSTCNVS